MKLTLTVSYAVGILLRIEAEGGGPLTAARIAKGGKFPPRFLYRVLRRLVDAGLLRGTSGPGGGYSLTRPAPRITLLDIVSAVEGPPQRVTLKPPHPKQRGAIRAINDLSRRQTVWMNRELRKLSLARLAKAGN